METTVKRRKEAIGRLHTVEKHQPTSFSQLLFKASSNVRIGAERLEAVEGSFHSSARYGNTRTLVTLAIDLRNLQLRACKKSNKGILESIRLSCVVSHDRRDCATTRIVIANKYYPVIVLLTIAWG